LAAVSVLYTNTKNTANNATINAYQIGARYQFTPALSAGGDYELMKGNAVLASDKANKANQLSLGARYSLSKRTVLYTEAVYQKVSGDNNPQAWIMAVSSASSNDKQLLMRLGILHRF
jgi:predicted porin